MTGEEDESSMKCIRAWRRDGDGGYEIGGGRKVDGVPVMSGEVCN